MAGRLAPRRLPDLHPSWPSDRPYFEPQPSDLHLMRCLCARRIRRQVRALCTASRLRSGQGPSPHRTNPSLPKPQAPLSSSNRPRQPPPPPFRPPPVCPTTTPLVPSSLSHDHAIGPPHKRSRDACWRASGQEADGEHAINEPPGRSYQPVPDRPPKAAGCAVMGGGAPLRSDRGGGSVIVLHGACTSMSNLFRCSTDCPSQPKLTWWREFLLGVNVLGLE